jgi:hypothetical protein
MPGVLPYAFFNNTVYFLLGREHKEVGWDGGNTFSDFGGSIDPKHTTTEFLAKFGATSADQDKVTASVEFWEETMGLFFTELEIYNLLKSKNDITLKSGPYVEHLLRIEYNPYWVTLFQNAYNYVLSCTAPHPTKIGYNIIPSCPEGYTEKTEIKWFSYNELETSMKTVNELRPDLVNTLRKIFATPQFSQLLAEASIFIDPSTKGNETPVQALPIIAPSEPTWPAFYPSPSDVGNVAGGTGTLQQQYQSLSNSCPKLFKNDFIKIFAYIDRINQIHYEISDFIKSSQSSTGVYWSSNYCPHMDTKLKIKSIGSGDYGTAESVIGPVTKCCNPSPIEFVIKSLKSSNIDESQLQKIKINYPILDGLTAPLNDNFATEVVALATTNMLASQSICYNLPYFYGVAKCAPTKMTYMYLQRIENSFKSTSISDSEFDSITLQGFMAILALWSQKLVHGDININNIAYNTTSPRHPVYKIDSQYYIGSPTDKVLYLIDFGFGFIKDQSEPQLRLQKDKDRYMNNINWTPTMKSGLLSQPVHLAYKGYYVPTSELSTQSSNIIRNAATIRRHLLDLYLFFETLKGFGISKIMHYQSMISRFYTSFVNPVVLASSIASPDEAIVNVWNVLLKEFLTLSNVRKITEAELLKLNPSELMFLGALELNFD